MQETVGVKELRGMRVGQTRIFTLRDVKKIRSVRVTVNSMKDENKEFTVRADRPSSSVSITRIK